MSELTIFNFQNHEVRTTMIDGEPWIVAKDIAEILGVTWNGAATIKHVPEEWRGVTSDVTIKGEREMLVLSKQGMYFFLGRSDKPLAIPFQKWVAGEVLPSIEKTGSYSVVKRDPITEMDRLAGMMNKFVPALSGSIIQLQTEQTEIVSRLDSVEQHQKEHDAKAIDSYRQGLHRCRDLLVFGTKGKPQPINWQGYWKELQKVCKVSSFDMKNQAALTVPVMKKAFEYASEWCKARGVNPPNFLDFIRVDEQQVSKSASV